jgi:hypothetical protein
MCMKKSLEIPKLYMEEGQTTQWPKDKRTNNDLQNSTQKTKDRVTRAPLKTRGELGCFGRVIQS